MRPDATLSSDLAEGVCGAFADLLSLHLSESREYGHDQPTGCGPGIQVFAHTHEPPVPTPGIVDQVEHVPC